MLTVPTIRQMMDRAGEEFFTGSRFTEEEDRGFGLRDSLRFGNRTLDRFRLTEDARKTISLRPLLSQEEVFGAQAQLVERAFDQEEQVIRIDRLLKEVVRAVFHRLHGFVNRAIRRHDDNRSVRVSSFCCS